MEYETFVADAEMIRDGEPVHLLIRDREQFQSMPVRAIVYRDASKAPDRLYAFTPLGISRNKEPWAIEILEEIDEELGGEERFRNCDSFGKK